MAPVESPFVASLMKYLYILEVVGVLALIIGLLLTAMKMDASLLIRASAGLLAGVFFLNAYRPPEPEPEEGERGGMKELLAATIVPKAAWIGCAVILIGILMFFTEGGSGATELLMIGCSSVAVVLILIVFFLASGVKQSKRLVPIVYRAIPVMIAALYILLR